MDRVDFDKWVGFTPKQLEAERVARLHRHTLYGGAAGGGKSYWLRWGLVRDLIRWYAQYGLEDVRVGLFCESYPALMDRQVVYLRREVPKWLGAYHTSSHELRLRPEYGSGVVALRNLDDPAKYRSAEFAGMAFDEVTLLEEWVYNYLQTRLRWVGLPEDEWRSRVATNPSGVGHLWVKRRWVDREFLPEERPEHYAFVPAKVQDNPHLPPGYAESLAHLPEELRRAYLEGDWNIFAGQVFSEWKKDVHVIKPRTLPKQWFRFRALDYGYEAPSAVGWFAVDDNSPTIYLYRELYQNRLGPAELADAIKQMTPADEHISYTTADPSLFRVNDQTAVSNAEVMASNGVPCDAGVNDRLSGWRMLHEFLRPFEEIVGGELVTTARLKVFESCRNVVRTLPAVVINERRPEDVDTNCEDHAADMIRYGVMSRPALQLHPPKPDAEREWQKGWRREFPESDPAPVGRSAGW